MFLIVLLHRFFFTWVQRFTQNLISVLWILRLWQMFCLFPQRKTYGKPQTSTGKRAMRCRPCATLQMKLICPTKFCVMSLHCSCSYAMRWCLLGNVENLQIDNEKGVQCTPTRALHGNRWYSTQHTAYTYTIATTCTYKGQTCAWNGEPEQLYLFRAENFNSIELHYLVYWFLWCTYHTRKFSSRPFPFSL